MIAANTASLRRHASVLGATVIAGSIAWFCAGKLVDSQVDQALKWTLFISLALTLEALIYVAWKVIRHDGSTAARPQTNEFQVHYRPVVNLRTGELVGAKALPRWRAKGNAIPATYFVTGLTRSVLRQVAEDYCTYLWACKDFTITVNLCARDILDQGFADFVADIMSTYNLPARTLVFAVAEGALFDQERALIQLQKLRAGGHPIAIDDVDTGGSSLSLSESGQMQLTPQALARRHFQLPVDVRSCTF